MSSNDQKQDIEPLKFIEVHLQQAFTEEKAQQLFQLYCVEENKNGNFHLGKLEPQDIRKLLFDILEAAKWPLIVPDESLDIVLNELCLHERGSVTWVEFKSFFVFLQDRPLLKLLELTTQVFSMDQLTYGRLVTLRQLQKIEGQSFDASPFKQIIAQLLPEAGPMFIYFLGSGSVLALVLGAFKEIAQFYQVEVTINNIPYAVEIKPFNKEIDVFPPITRAGGIKSKVARRLADTYILSKKWDEENFRVGEKTTTAVKKVEEKMKQIDKKYKLQERFSAFSASVISSTKAFDEKHQISQRMNDKAKSIDEQYQIRKKLKDAYEKIQSNEKVKVMTGKVSQIVKDVEDLSKETNQLIQEKEQHELNVSFSLEEGKVTETEITQLPPPPTSLPVYYNQYHQQQDHFEYDGNQSFVGVSDIVPDTSIKPNTIPQLANI